MSRPQPADPPEPVGAAATPADVDATAELVDRLSEAVLAVDGVVEMHQGPFGDVATYLPGRRVPGLRLRDDGIDVHVGIEWGAPAPAVADAIRRAVRVMAPGRRVDVTIADVGVRTGGRAEREEETS